MWILHPYFITYTHSFYCTSELWQCHKRYQDIVNFRTKLYNWEDHSPIRKKKYYKLNKIILKLLFFIFCFLNLLPFVVLFSSVLISPATPTTTTPNLLSPSLMSGMGSNTTTVETNWPSSVSFSHPFSFFFFLRSRIWSSLHASTLSATPYGKNHYSAQCFPRLVAHKVLFFDFHMNLVCGLWTKL